MLHVMRAGPGTRVVLFDGSGAEFAAEVRRAGRGEVELAILARVEVDRELSGELVLGVALPKGERQKWLVEKAVELGVRRLAPLRTARSVAQPGAEALKRLRRAVIEASKQCGRNRLMEVSEPQAWDEWLAAWGEGAVRLVAHPGAHTVGGDSVASHSRYALAVGPEGGFTEEEIDRAMAAGWQLVGLGPRILRVETAALALAAIVGSRIEAGPGQR